MDRLSDGGPTPPASTSRYGDTESRLGFTCDGIFSASLFKETAKAFYCDNKNRHPLDAGGDFSVCGVEEGVGAAAGRSGLIELNLWVLHPRISAYLNYRTSRAP